MKKIIFLVCALFILTACTAEQKEQAPQPTAPPPPASPPRSPIPNTCVTNNDCVRTGCSGNICQSQKQEPVFSTCEFKPEYECYNEVPCGCVQGSCQWSNEPPYTGVLEKCLAEKKGNAVDEQGVPIV